MNFEPYCAAREQEPAKHGCDRDWFAGHCQEANIQVPMPSAPVIDPPLIDLRHITVMRGANIALHDLSLTIGAGEHVAILGPNGCGKSTLIKTITRECYPLAQAGSSVSILGHTSWDVFD